MQYTKLKLRDCVENIPKVKANCNFPPFKNN